MDAGPGSSTLELIFLAVLILLNAFFAASEMAIVSLNKAKITHLANEGNGKAKLLTKLFNEPGKFLATIQVGITLAGFLASASAATTLSLNLSALLKRFNIPAADKIALIATTVLLSYITLVLGELLPKRIALQYSEKISMAVVKPILLVSKLTLPFVNLLTGSTNIMVRIFGLDSKDLEEKVSEEEIRMMINVGEENGVINETEKEMLDGIFEFDDTLAKEIMTPRPDVFAVNVDTPIDILVDEILKEQYSRIPVYEDDIDNIIGVLYMKDLFIHIRNKDLEGINIRDILRQPYFIPETKNIDTLFKELQSTKNHMAILIDEYGGFSGIVTIEDLIEEVMGNIFDEYDEYDENHDMIKEIDAHTYMVNGLVSINEINENLHLSLPTDNFDTINGFIVDLLGSIPEEDMEQTIEYENLTFKIEEVNEKRIETLKICINE